jgi:diphthine methyl ester acylhydrolase
MAKDISVTCENVVPSIQSISLKLPPSCIEFCPAYPEFFVVGTYFLETSPATNSAQALDDESSTSEPLKKRQDRNGSLVLYRLKDDMMCVFTCIF